MEFGFVEGNVRLKVDDIIRESALTDQKKESQIAHYRDKQAVYER